MDGGPGCACRRQAHQSERKISPRIYIIEPNDVDCVLLIGDGFPIDRSAEAELISGLPFLELNLVGHVDFNEYVDFIFVTDRLGVPKGMVEVIL